jgi:hypothetical protein
MKQQPARFCSGCGKILDEIQPANHPMPWIEAGSFLAKYGFTWDDLDLRQSFCPGCQKVIETAKARNVRRPDPNATL